MDSGFLQNDGLLERAVPLGGERLISLMEVMAVNELIRDRQAGWHCYEARGD